MHGNKAACLEEDLRSCASAAADLAATEDLVSCDGASVSEHVKSHTNVRSWDPGWAQHHQVSCTLSSNILNDVSEKQTSFL